MRRAANLALFLMGGVAVAQTPGTTIQLRDAGPGVGPELLASELARPYRLVPPASMRFLLSRDSTFRRTGIVLGRDVVVEGKVEGDLVVVGGDLYMHPGAVINGRAIAIGGGVYESTLASIGGGPTAFRDFTYDITPTPTGYVLDYRPFRVRDSSALTWPGLFGVRVPSYDRTNGLSLGAGPRYHFQNTGLSVEPTLSYRSQLGRLDPSLGVVDSIGRRSALELRVERNTFSNDAWIWSDLVNSLSFLAGGEDSRNYYRATRAELTYGRRWESVNGELSPWIGALVERARSVRPGIDASGGPWTFFGRHGDDDALRPNPPVAPATTVSAVAGARWSWEENGVTAHAEPTIEWGRTAADCENCNATSSTFAQITVNGRVQFPTFGTQTASVHAHTVMSSHGADGVPQRFAYLGGGGTLSTLPMLSLGGDELVFVDFRYNIPVDRIQLPIIGPPVVTLREALGGADVGRFPTLHQATGVRLSASVFYVEYLVDPAARRGHAGVGLSLNR